MDYYSYNEFEDNNTFRKESFLKERGYSSNLPAEKRRKIILELIEEDERNIYRILQHLQWLINFNGIINTQAQMVWESDWRFLNDYVREKNQKNLYVE